MKPQARQNRNLPGLFARIPGSSAAMTGILVLVFWIVRIPSPFREPSPVPMAPITALLFVILGGVAAWTARGIPQRRWLTAARLASMTSGFLAILLFCLSLPGTRTAWEHLGMTLNHGDFGIPLGHISPLSAFYFILAASSMTLSLWSPPSSKRMKLAFWIAGCMTCGAFILLIAYLVGSPLLPWGVYIPPALSTTIAFIFLGMAATIPAVLKSWPEAVSAAGPDKRMLNIVLLAFTLAGGGIVSAGYFYFKIQTKTFKTQIELQLSSIAGLKAEELGNWRNERLGDAGIVYKNVNFSDLTSRFLASPGTPGLHDRLEIWLAKFGETYPYDRIALYDTLGKPLLTAKGDDDTPPLRQEWRQSALVSRTVQFIDFHRDDRSQKLFLSLIIPILKEDESSRTIALAEMRIDPNHLLYPIIRQWPLNSLSSETLLGRRNGDSILFLNDARYGSTTALKFQTPVFNNLVSTGQAATGREGFYEGVDYRGVFVMADVRPVAESPWLLISKMDLAEVVGPLRERLNTILALIVMFLLSMTAMAGWVWRHRRARFYRERFDSSEALRKSEERYHRTLDGMMEGCQIIDNEWRYLYVNDTAARYRHRDKLELLGRTVMETCPDIETTHLFSWMRQCMETRLPARTELEFTFPEGNRVWFEFSIQPIPEGLFILTLDITRRKNDEAKIAKLARTNAMLSDINQTIVRDRNMNVVFTNVCRIAIQKGGFPFAWIGMVDRSTGVCEPVSMAGVADGYLEMVAPSITGAAGCHCPVDHVLRNGRHMICDLQSRMDSPAPCQTKAHDLGFRSIASFPLMEGGIVRGAFTFYSKEQGTFDREELALLDEVAMDISFAMEVEKKETTRSQTEKTLERSEKTLRAIFENIRDGILVIDRETRRFVIANRTIGRMLGYTRSQLLRLHMEDIHPPEAISDLQEKFQRQITGDASLAQDVPVRRCDGSIFYADINSAPVEFDGRICLLGIFHDVTDRRDSEQALERERAHLEEAVKQRTGELHDSLQNLKDLNLRLEETGRHKSRFLSSMSHELRTPLNAIIGFSDLLKSRSFGELNDKQNTYVTQVEESGKHLLALISDLLDISRIDAGAMTSEPAPLDIRETVQATISLLGSQFRKKNLSVLSSIHSPFPEAYADLRKCKQILLNLLSNAIKFTPAGGTITVSAIARENDLLIEVRDTGIGISKKDQERLFSEFFQVDHIRDEQLGGTGIGLALTRRLVELQGGTISVESEPGAGSCFSFTLQKVLLPAKTGQKGTTAPGHSTVNGLRVLIADDNKSNLDMLTDMLSLWHHEVAVAGNGQQALDLARTFKPHIIFMDMRMPVMDGLEATRQIRLMPGYDAIPIVALTASAGKGVAADCLAAGCTLHRAKPVQINDIGELFNRFFNNETGAIPTPVKDVE